MDKTKRCYLFFDYDGTVYINKTIPDETLQAMLAAQRMGHMLIMNTGRSWGEAAYNKFAFTVVPWDATVCGGGDIRVGGEMKVEHTVPRDGASLSSADSGSAWILTLQRTPIPLPRKNARR